MEEKILINIGRQFGSGGRLVAQAIGRKLDIPVYDNELISKAPGACSPSPAFSPTPGSESLTTT